MKKLISFLIALLISVSVRAELNLELPDLNLPDLGGGSSGFTVSLKERERGLTILRKLRDSGQLIENPEINLWIRSLGNRLISRAPSSPNPFYFVVSRDHSVNAFATLGGVIVINSGLILHTSSESELAAVIAHEIAHVTQRHIPRMLEKADNNKLATGAALLAGIIAASKDSQAGAAIINTTLAASAHKQLAFGREAEAEADRVGLRILAGSGLDPKAMPEFLQKLEQYGDSQNADIREFLQNHPLTVKRVSDTFVRASQFGPFRGKENIHYLYMREKIRALIGAKIPPPASLPLAIKEYSSAMQLKQRGAFHPALQTIEKAVNNDVSEAILLAELHNQQKQFQQTISILAPLMGIYPGNEALSIPLAQAYISTGQVNQAWKILKEIHISEQTSLETFEVKQEAARLLGYTSHAYRAVAERSIRTGRYKSALIQLRQAIKQPGSNVGELQEMEQLIKQLEQA